jgi:hypothetical protein
MARLSALHEYDIRMCVQAAQVLARAGLQAA